MGLCRYVRLDINFKHDANGSKTCGEVKTAAELQSVHVYVIALPNNIPIFKKYHVVFKKVLNIIMHTLRIFQIGENWRR